MTVDLSGIDPDLNTSIRVRVDIGSWVNTTTPVLDKLTVKWIDRDTWRDQFYTTTRVERSLNMVVSGGTLAPVDAATAGPTIV
ncbi:MAG: hypothetical protein GWN18_01475, partial [Thermoplasmata archaeon]|nr:hypothetical protein [Thermoplasmata archaeon]NIS10675.1 hypothetical protein [Thermoplasmata archaeon]NIS18626.1 hypothetical protein [Thermoplasmata archaeon]NIV77429.1 hypothetical protein [Thermoplasmata archaeon]NIW81259.1 hypothetical protein [Thermoplasmata archaeon]